MLLSKKHSVFGLVFSLLGLVMSSIFLSPDDHPQLEQQNKIARFEEQLQKQQKKLKSTVEELAVLNTKNNFTRNNEKLHNYYLNEGITLYIQKDSLFTYWNSNAEALENVAKQKDGFVKTKSGWYEKFSIQKNNVTYAGLQLIKREHRIENSYVKNQFFRHFNLPPEYRIEFNFSNNGITSLTGNKISVNPQYADENEAKTSLVMIDGFCILSFFVFLYIVFKFSKKTPKQLLLLATVLLVSRWLMMHFLFPFQFYRHEINGPEFFAYSSWFPSLGDYVLNGLSFFLISLALLEMPINQEKIHQLSTFKKRILLFLMILLMAIAAVALVLLIEILVLNSNVELDPKKIATVNFYSVVSIAGIMFFLYCFVLLTQKVAEFLKICSFSKTTLIVGGLVYLTIMLLFGFWENSTSLLLLFLLSLLIFYRTFKTFQTLNISYSVFFIVLLSLFTSTSLEHFLSSKESDKLKQKALLMGSERDPIAEYLFTSLMEKSANDANMATINSENEGTLYLRKKYFSKYLDKYDFTWKKTSKKEFLDLVSPLDEIQTNALYYQAEKENESASYIGKLPIPNNEFIMVKFHQKSNLNEEGFPMLLLNKKAEAEVLSENYSHAKYYRNKLQSNKGNFHYPLVLTELVNYKEGDFQWLENQNFSHLVYSPNKYSSIVITREMGGMWEFLSGYSYLFILFGSIALLIFVFRLNLKSEKKITLNFKSRLQLNILLILLLSSITIGVGSIYFIAKQYDKKNREAISEKIKSVKLQVQKAMDTPNFSNDSTAVNEAITSFSKVFFSDINLYNNKGQLIVSSRPDVFEEALISTNMHPKAFIEMNEKKQSEYVQIEKIQELEFLSAYTPFYHKNQAVAGYINLPYFAKNTALRDEISNFVVTLINIYGLLVVLSILTALFIADRLTKPLSLIQDKLRNISLGKSNEPIVYSGKDEIGKLVAEYNKMIEELGESAIRLAQSEREGAWREMAKQVAHEIKNPLTPMKLNVQHLQRLYNDTSKEEFEERLKKISKSLIDQIDTLSNIATEFSNFAKMPEPKLEEIDLSEIIKTCQQLYTDTENIEISFQSSCSSAIVKADKDQMIRLFNNLVKNAIQAIPQEREGKIAFTLSTNTNGFLVTLTDNGKGISENDKEKIFIPNFTTKNSGMGLGLAMSKQIIENLNGKIWFETEVDKGTTFYIQFNAPISNITG